MESFFFLYTRGRASSQASHEELHLGTTARRRKQIYHRSYLGLDKNLSHARDTHNETAVFQTEDTGTRRAHTKPRASHAARPKNINSHKTSTKPRDSHAARPKKKATHTKPTTTHEYMNSHEAVNFSHAHKAARLTRSET